ncbi:DinB family protein [Blastopirellula sp. JC732]|uniref:DinB family protein n=1 Tax=Blastopirellula sediminis TaxID=2894196 RepID=A0A9X1MP00_9BACT|nr:DinB family protein [Blastopirellula sediminis]MCC9606018.1 DinB family protein [Blastopirellula sediminis]MCC9630683.1 DinB family protein [Blastopirellula sediminis]
MPDAAVWEAVKKNVSMSFQMFDSHLDDVDKADWFRMPGDVTHVAWQVGHITIAAYGIGLRMQRGASPADAELGLANYKELFGQGSTPSADASKYPSAETLHANLKKVFAQVEKEMAEYKLSELDDALDPGHPLFKTRFAAMSFLPAHNFMHYGQVSLLRRLFGAAPIR